MKELSTNLIRHIYRTTQGRYTIIGLGGVFTAEDAYEKIKAGASLVQIITGLIYGGPETVKRINQGLVKLLHRDGYQPYKRSCRKGINKKIIAIMPTILNAKPKLANTVLVKFIQKRDGAVVPFLKEKITDAIQKAMTATGEGSAQEAEMVANKVYADVVRITKKYKTFIPNVEGIQDTVEKELILSEYVKTAKAYILYREKRAKLRESGVNVPSKVRKLAQESKKFSRIL